MLETYCETAKRLGMRCSSERDAVHEISHWLDFDVLKTAMTELQPDAAAERLALIDSLRQEK